MIGLLGY